MNSTQVRNTFFNFFKAKQHIIVPSSPMVIKNDPTLMFTNAGMNQFKDIFLGNKIAVNPRVANTQKCLRVSGKHNDLEQVGHDTYHHTMFEMLGNWSFGDYFKEEAIAWAWELLTEVYKIDKDRLYITVFGGDEKEGLARDSESYEIWKKIVSENRIFFGTRKDNFWEMGDIGPCGPCSEVHIDLRNDDERKKVDAMKLINTDHNLVIEIWNLVFIEFNRQANGKLISLPAKHVDTGMGFERLCMVLQGKQSNYDTDVFQSIIKEIASLAGKQYGKELKSDIAMRVIADHLRAVAFAIADGQLPSNNKAGYVIRRILRRAVRYGYTFLEFKEPFMGSLVPILVKQLSDVFPEIKAQQELIQKVITEEEFSFLKTLATGINKFVFYTNISAQLPAEYEQQHFSKIISDEEFEEKKRNRFVIDGEFAFELFDTYGFPIDLTQLMASEKGWTVDMDGFNKFMQQQKERSRHAATVDTEDWIVLKDLKETVFVGYDVLEADAELVKYRKVKTKEKEFFQLVFNTTPFYAESGGQAGDMGFIVSGKEKISVENTIKENELIIHLIKKLPAKLDSSMKLLVDEEKRRQTENNHTATHLLHAALKEVLGNHVEQKGSLVNDERLRFDFSHYAKLTEEEISKVELLLNKKIRENILLEELRSIPIKRAQEMGAVALFGEKYGDHVRVISFDKNYSVELCGGTHVKATGQIGICKIISESAIAAGVRRIEAITADHAEAYINSQFKVLDDIRQLLKAPKDMVKAVEVYLQQYADLSKQMEEVNKEKAMGLKDELIIKIETINGINFIAVKLELEPNNIKDLAYAIKKEVDNLFLVIGGEYEGKASLTIMIAENLVKEKGLDARVIIKETAKEINGGGGGQDFFATAGGKNPEGIEKALAKARTFLK